MANTKQKHNYLFYGTRCNATEVERFIEHNLSMNALAEAKGRKKTPLCIWGRHGVGKTELVEALAKRKGYQWAYIAPAQFEEMGDLVGMPQIVEGQTHFAAPDWVPTTEGPGILLIDDVNRADDRILRGIMQLLQNYELVSWKLPAKWQIVLTANPDGGDYSVTPMDDAMLTRMMHITMDFDVKIWAKWAENYGIDPRGINFLLTYPEVVTGERSTPRSLVQFFESIAPIEDLQKELPLVQMLADSCLDGSTVAAFVNFVNNNLSQLISPEEILQSKDFEKEVFKRIDESVNRGTLRVDILATLATRLVNYLTLANRKFEVAELNNVKAFIKMKFLPNDIRLAMAQDLVTASNPVLKTIMADPEIAQILLKRM